MSHICTFHPENTFELLPKILKVMNAGGAIMKDKGVSMLLSLYNNPIYKEDAKFLMLEQLSLAPDNQFGQYVEKWTLIIDQKDIDDLIFVVESRIPDLADPIHQSRAAKCLKKLLRKKFMRI
jgi:hypothetical protein